MPFVGEVTGRPSVLSGSVEKFLNQADRYLEKGVYGVDLLGYRYVGDANLLNETFVSTEHAPVCLAGSIDSYSRLDDVCRIAPAFFTIGSAFFENKFGSTLPEQIDNVYNYIQNNV